MTYTAIDCQCFAGGFTLGLVQAGFKLIGKREMKGGFGVANCEANRHLLGVDWDAEAVSPEAWSVPQGGADLVAGNPPCSGFSVLSSKEFRGADSKINACMWSFVEYAARVRPQIAIFESVQLAYAQGHQLMRDLRLRLEELTGEQWDLHHVLHNALSVGGPAMRKRYFWVASRVPFGVDTPKLKWIPELRDVIGDLIGLRDQWGAQPYRRPPTWYTQRLRNPDGVVDGHVFIDNPNTRRTRQLLAAVDWLPNEHAQKVTKRYFDRYGDLPPLWEHLTEKLKGQDFFQGFNTPTMWNPEHHARVITGAGLLNTVHWKESRTYTHREAARILGFPDEWLIEPLMHTSGLFLTWGKGITVDCGRWIADLAQRALNGSPAESAGELIGDREFLHDVTNTWKKACDTINTSNKTMRQDFNPERRKKFVSEAVATEARKGRPRPVEALQRDHDVFQMLTEPLSRDALTERMSTTAGVPVEPNLIYLSLWRLRRDGHIVRDRANGAYVWTRVEGSEGPTAPAPAPTPAE